MDSMRHLSTSLPRASSRRTDSTAALLSDFKAAALSVTNLYKTAATAQTKARAGGYQDALDDILAFLDKENLGLMDGEGWRIRQWATARLDSDGSGPRQGTSAGSNTDDEEDQQRSTAKDEDKYDERSSSPEVQKRPPTLPASSSLVEDEAPSHRRVISEPPQLGASLPHQPATPQPLSGNFTFQSSHPYPTIHNREGMELDTTQTQPSSTTAQVNPTDTVRIMPRHSRSNRHNRRNENRSSSLNINLGSGAGSKRKIPYPDFFDISGFPGASERKDSSASGRGSKRGRHV